MSRDQKRRAICAEVARILHQERIRRGFSMTLVAEKAGLSQQMVSYVERQMRVPTIDTLLRISYVLGVSAADVLRQAEEAVQDRG